MISTRIEGADRVITRTCLMPKEMSLAVKSALGSPLPFVLVTEKYSNDKGKNLGVAHGAISVQDYLRMAAKL
jgi:hypothetical protein